MSSPYMPSLPQNTTAPQQPAKPIIFSVCIPRVFKNISKKRILAILYSLKVGFVERLDMVAKTGTNGVEFWCVFAHFSEWNDHNPKAVQMREKLMSGDKIKIVYDNPWYWLVSQSGGAHNEKATCHRPAPFIDFDHTPSVTKTEIAKDIPSPDWGSNPEWSESIIEEMSKLDYNVRHTKKCTCVRCHPHKQ